VVCDYRQIEPEGLDTLLLLVYVTAAATAASTAPTATMTAASTTGPPGAVRFITGRDWWSNPRSRMTQ
jgi:hypothetical protein